MKVGVWCAVSARIVGLFKRNKRKRYLRAEGQHSEHILLSVNCYYFIPNVIGGQACSFLGKICMRLVASGAPSAVKHRTVESVKKVKILPVQQ
jgi:hypothetical protein